ncbi:glycine/betaine ABC transporter [Corynebacterium hadale]|uniref:Glycine/betaine ABC transporter n=1 Tax=Corynebacterium hadale TaxID=2026255 RepID=A0A269PDQ0_9CORY|nr:BCCT family transporter [Corynebacterium hadale]PAJ70008.1 glycine/betaine ABC transporter [Corynebacterium hadale]PAT05910.1 glycine/betaine ABC transporter [Corynebacterium hadale]PAT10680.1 glycine/betaine ABC transporter [Corynebacterium hadale]PAT11642.1 glycine/betaine ABC transporter [Corynebacterium hadale]WKC59675.1 Glycine betaine transporter BetP [Corynebacterium hadale]
MSRRETGLDPHDPGAEPRTADPQIENNSTDPAPSAAGELVSLLQADSAGERGNYQDPEEQIERQADAENAPVDWGIIAPLAVIIVAIVGWGLLAPESFSGFADAAFGWVINNLGWAFVLGGTAFVVFVLVIACSNFGTIRLGSADERPEFKTTSWIAMMFAAGMGIGLMFYGASEPLAMYRDGVPGHEPHEVGTAMSQTMFHWTLHPWAVYAIMGLAIAYSTFRLGRKQLLSSAFIPLIGQKAADGPLGKLIDGFAIFATIFGTACSLGLGAMQISSGLEASGFVHDPSNGLIIGIVAVLTLAFLLSAMSGVSKGIQWLSNTNMVIAALLAIFVFVFGPTVVQLNLLPTSVGTYLQNFFEMAGRTAESADGEAGDFLSSWTIFYWAWWISWSPFVGTFLARISRGRTIREFCLGVLLVPSGLSTVWFAIFGGTAIHMEQTGESIYADGSSEQQLFNLLHSLPGGVVMGVFALLLLATFFITSADSASTVMASMTQNGKSDAKPWIAAMWGLATAAVGLTLLISGGSDALNSLQSVTIVAATPFLLILIALMFAIVKDLSNDTIYLDKKEQERFSRQLAIERRMHRDQRELNARKAQVKRAFTGKRK